jgi:hypothetical protein
MNIENSADLKEKCRVAVGLKGGVRYGRFVEVGVVTDADGVLVVR